MSGHRRRSTSAAHLVRRFLGSLSRRQPDGADLAVVRGLLSDSELALWSTMRVVDRRHSIEVLHDFDELEPDADDASRAGALLHDVGKLASDLGVMSRVVATLVGPRGRRFREYHDHVAIGVRMLVAAGSRPATIAAIAGHGPLSPSLQAADDGVLLRSARRRAGTGDGRGSGQ